MFRETCFRFYTAAKNTPNTVICKHPTPVNVIIYLFVYHFLFVAIQEVQQQKVWIAAAQVPLNSSSTESSATEMKVAFQIA